MPNFNDIADLEKQHKKYTKIDNQYRKEFEGFKPVRRVMSKSKNYYKDPYKACLNDEDCRKECYADPKCAKNISNHKQIYDDNKLYYDSDDEFDEFEDRAYKTTNELKDIVDTAAENATENVYRLQQNMRDINENVNDALNQMNRMIRQDMNIDSEADDMFDDFDKTSTQDSDDNDFDIDIDNDNNSDTDSIDDLLAELDESIALENNRNINRGRRSVQLNKIAKECAKRLAKRNKH